MSDKRSAQGALDGVNRDAVVGTRPNNTGFLTAGDLLDEIERLRAALDVADHTGGCLAATGDGPCECFKSVLDGR